jgi:hypothetical protein
VFEVVEEEEEEEEGGIGSTETIFEIPERSDYENGRREKESKFQRDEKFINGEFCSDTITRIASQKEEQ